jgi:hypothetical protein
MSAEQTNAVLRLALFRVLKMLAKVAIRYGVSAGTVTELVRRAFVDAAEESLTVNNKKPIISRVCTVTGLYRKEVVRIKALPPVDSIDIDDRYNRSARVISGWVRDRDFCTKAGRPAVLSVDGGKNSFAELVRRYSGDMTPRSVLEELTRLKAVEVTKNQSVKLLNRAYVPSSDERAILQIIGSDTADLIETISFNLDQPVENRRFQRRVAYLHIPVRHAKPFQDYAAKESQKLLEKLDAWLARRDTDHPSLGTPGVRLGLGIYQILHHNTEADIKQYTSVDADGVDANGFDAGSTGKDL